MTKHSNKFDKVKGYYDAGLWDKRRVKEAVTHPSHEPWITSDEYQEITGEEYAAEV